MDKAFASTLTPSASTRKTAARAALVGFNDVTHSVIADCFRQFGIEPVPVTTDAQDRLRREKFEACVLPLGGWSDSESIMEAARSQGASAMMRQSLDALVISSHHRCSFRPAA